MKRLPVFVGGLCALLVGTSFRAQQCDAAMAEIGRVYRALRGEP